MFKRKTLVCMLLMVICSEGYALSLFDIGKVCLFSGISGHVLLNGEPVSNAKVIQTYNSSLKKDSITTKTDKNGNFQFDAVYTNTIRKYAPVEPTIHQEILIQYDGNEYEAWVTFKHIWKENSELDGKPINLICELTEEATTKSSGLKKISGICKWK